MVLLLRVLQAVCLLVVIVGVIGAVTALAADNSDTAVSYILPAVACALNLVNFQLLLRRCE